MMVNTYGQANRAIVVSGKIREAFTRIHLIAVIAQVVFAGLRRTHIRDCIGRAIPPAGFTGITEGGDPRIYRTISLQGHVSDHTA